MKLTGKILFGMGLGILVGTFIYTGQSFQWFPTAFSEQLQIWLVGGLFDTVGQIFVASLKLMVVPVVFFSLVCGTASMGADARMGRMAIHTLALYLLTTGIAVTIALVVANVIDPGVGINQGEGMVFEAKESPSVKQVLVDIFPSNPVQAMADGHMLQIIVFCVLLGIAISLSGKAGERALEICQAFNEVVLKMVTIIMHLAPYGVFALLAKLFSELGWQAILNLGWYFLAVTLVLVIHAFAVYPSLLKLLSGLNPITFFKNVRPAMIFGFSTSSSAATMPVTMNVAEKRLGVDNRIASFTIPVGATINMDGTAIMQGVATVFIAQAFNVDIGMGGYLLVIATATLASIGTVAVPSAGIVMLTMVLQQVGLPVEGIALIIGVDRLLDMMRTAVNVSGDCMVTSVVAVRNGMLDREVFNDVSDLDEYEASQAEQQPSTSS